MNHKTKQKMNIKKIEVEVPIFGTTGPNGAEFHKVEDPKDLENSGLNFETYTIKEGEILRFPKREDMDIFWRAIRKGNKNGFNVVKCESEYKGKKKVTYFSLPSLRTIDVNNVPVNPTWFELGNDEARLQMLAKIGEIEGKKEISIEVYDLDEGGKRKQVQLFNLDGTPQYKDGKTVWEDKTKSRKVVVITPVPDAK